MPENGEIVSDVIWCIKNVISLILFICTRNMLVHAFFLCQVILSAIHKWSSHSFILTKKMVGTHHALLFILRLCLLVRRIMWFLFVLHSDFPRIFIINFVGTGMRIFCQSRRVKCKKKIHEWWNSAFEAFPLSTY